MPGRLVRSQTAVRVAELLGSREGRRHLGNYGWTQGMPVVMTQPEESLDEPSPVLEVVPASAPRSTIKDLFAQAEHSGMAAFRVKYWQYSAVAHAVPHFDANAPGHSYAAQESGSSS